MYHHKSKVFFEEPPSIFYNFNTQEEGNSTCEFARSSMYLVPQNASELSKSKFSFSVLFTPLATPRNKTQLLPHADKTDSKILRCSRCGSFVNPFYIFTDNNQTYQCNICEFKGPVPENVFDPNVYIDTNSHPEMSQAVYDFIVPDSYKLAEVRNNSILFCFDMSLESLTNGSMFQSLESIQSTLEYLDEDVFLGFLLYDTAVTFLKVEEGEISMARNMDPSAPSTLS